MSRINTNIQSLVARRVLNRNNEAFSTSINRLSTGLRINSGKDDPAGLIASENLRASKAAINAAIDNSIRADNIVSIAEGGLQELNSLLLELETLVDQSANEAGLSQAEVAANQLQIDTILSSVNRLASSTEFSGKKLLNGAFNFTTSGNTFSDLNISAVNVKSAKIPNGASRSVVVEVLSASDFAFVSANGGGSAGALSAATTLQIQGNLGAEVLSFASGTTASAIAAAVNQSTALTGVQASVASASGIEYVTYQSSELGSDQFVSVDVLSGAYTTTTTRDTGVDGTVTINGTSATVAGRVASINTSSLSVDLTLSLDFARGLTSGNNATFDVTGGGAIFSISPKVGLAGQEAIGIQSVSSGSLGNGVTGFLSSLGSGQANDLASKNFATAQSIIREAQTQVSTLRGRIGAFQRNTLQTTINSLRVAFENTAAAESAIRDTDFARETSELTRSQILVNSSTSTLQLANAAPQNVLSLLG
jgi:flagellin